MPKHNLTAVEKQVKIGLLSGSSINSLVRKLGVKKTNVYNIVDKLISWGEIEEMFYKDGTMMRPFNPRMFRDPAEKSLPISKDIGRNVPEKIDGVNQKFDPCGNTIPTINMRGICVSKDCPEGYVQGHIAGDIEFTVIEVGEFGNLKGPDGLSYGFFFKEIKNNGKAGKQRKADIRLFNQEISAVFRWYENSDTKMFILYPARLYFDPNLFENVSEVKEAFMERAHFVAYLLRLNGWVITDPVIKGKVHYPFTNPGLAQHFDPDSYYEGADLIVDSSLGTPEVEMVNSDDPLFHEKAKIMANLPTEIMQLKANDARSIRSFADLQQENLMLRQMLDEMTATMVRMAEVQNMQINFGAKQLKLNNDLLKMQSNDTGLKLTNNQQSLDDFLNKVGEKKDFDPRNHNRLEGYQ